MSEPTTAAGRALLSAAAANEAPVWSGPDLVALEAAVLKIEAEARAQGALHENLAAEGDMERALAAYRADLAAKVRGLSSRAMEFTTERAGFDDALHAVAALLEGEPR